MSPWLNTLRYKICALGAALGVSSFRLANVPVYWTYVLALFVVGCTTMIQNDWRDRFQDAKKGKTLAVDHPVRFKIWLGFFWILSIVLVVQAIRENLVMGLLLAGFSLVSLFYSEVRRIPMLPAIWVAVTAASPALLPLVLGAESTGNLLLFASTALLIFGREVHKDLDDIHVDGGYKWTLPVVFGQGISKLVICITVILGAIITVAISIWVLPAAIFVLFSLVNLLRGLNPLKARNLLDIGVALAIAIIILTGSYIT